MKTFKTAGILLLFLAFTNQAKAQTTTWTFDSAANDGWAARLYSNASGFVTKIQLANAKDNWSDMEIVEANEEQNYFRVKSTATGKIYEIYVGWDEDDLIVVFPDTTEKKFWLRKS
jgi:hypothetical protein